MMGMIRIVFAFSLSAAFAVQAEEKSSTAPSRAPQPKVEWVERCDRVAEAKRVDCLEKLRTEALQHFLNNADQNPATQTPHSGQTPKQPG